MGVSFTVPPRVGRAYFALQAGAGALWWVGVAALPSVRTATLGGLDPVAVAAADLPLFVLASALAAAGVRTAAVVATGWTVVVAVAMAVYATATREAGVGVLLMLGAAVCSVLALCVVRWGRIPAEWIVQGPFRFRPAASAHSTAAHVAATFGQLVVFWGVFLAAAPAAIAFVEERWRLRVAFPPGAGIVGVVVLTLASALGIGAAIAMSARGGGTPLPVAMPNRLVIAGPYRFVRNPMALAGITQGAAVGLLLGSWLVVAYAIAGSLVWNLLVRPFEEDDLAQRFGEQFIDYRENVRCWLPRVTPWAPSSRPVPAP
ncbi:methyltransferase family protein [Leifsonia aquatica]|uniref:methyltransferase family protein n=1 Tax=Leifsonia aquatica TaxID=144185 RepID=UPI0004684A52|nr:isoprenylcysteine carboxylmethyltransferase family protein [Leifsonia aquatica]